MKNIKLLVFCINFTLNDNVQNIIQLSFLQYIMYKYSFIEFQVYTDIYITVHLFYYTVSYIYILIHMHIYTGTLYVHECRQYTSNKY